MSVSSHRDGSFLNLLITDDQLNGDFLDLRFSDAVTNLLIAVIKLCPETVFQ